MRANYTTYGNRRGLNWSTLGEMRISELAFYTRLTVPREDTPGMRTGRLFHTAILEPETLDEVYAIWDGGRRGTNAYREWLAEVGDREEITRDEYNAAMEAAASVFRHKAARAVLSGGKVEQTITWVDPRTHIRCKARPDHIKRTGALTDLKSARTIDAREFGRVVQRLGYFGQMAYYRRGLTANGYPEDAPTRIVAVEQKAPYDVAVFTVPDYVLSEGDRLINQLMDKVLVWRRRKPPWPGRYPEEQELEFPTWALSDDTFTDEIEVLS